MINSHFINSPLNFLEVTRLLISQRFQLTQGKYRKDATKLPISSAIHNRKYLNMAKIFNASEVATEILNNHVITKWLRDLGLTDEHLDGLKFRPVKKDLEFRLWAYQWSEGTPLQAHHLFKAYCTLKWLLIEDPPYSRDKEDALALIALTEASHLTGIGLKTKLAQSKRAKNLRGKIPDTGTTLNKIIHELALNRIHESLRAKELWAPFFAELEEIGLQPSSLEAPILAKCVYEYGPENNRRRISFGRFANVVSKARQKKSR